MPKLLLVMIGGALGAGLRWEIGRYALRKLGGTFPWGTLAANLVGGLLIGILAARLVEPGPDDRIWLFLAVGLLGGFTTFSAFSLDVFAMLQRGQAGPAFGYVAFSVLGSLLLLALGYWASRGAAA